MYDYSTLQPTMGSIGLQVLLQLTTAYYSPLWVLQFTGLTTTYYSLLWEIPGFADVRSGRPVNYVESNPPPRPPSFPPSSPNLAIPLPFSLDLAIHLSFSFVAQSRNHTKNRCQEHILIGTDHL